MRLASGVITEARAAAAALSFLTTLPVPSRLATNCDDLARAAPSFPLVGAGIGGCVGALLSAVPGPASLAAGLGLALALLMTGAIHLDALADTADALGSRDRPRALEIMRDPRLGAYGVTALIVVLLIEAAALAELAVLGATETIVASFALSRSAAPCLACLLPHARLGPGLARTLAGGHRVRAGVSAAAAVCLTLLVAPQPWPLLASAAAAWVIALWISRQRFGGVTGDTLGAALTLTEACCLAAAAATLG